MTEPSAPFVAQQSPTHASESHFPGTVRACVLCVCVCVCLCDMDTRTAHFLNLSLKTTGQSAFSPTARSRPQITPRQTPDAFWITDRKHLCQRKHFGWGGAWNQPLPSKSNILNSPSHGTPAQFQTCYSSMPKSSS